MPVFWLRKETKRDIGSTYPLYISVYAKFSVNQSFLVFLKTTLFFWQPLPILSKNIEFKEQEKKSKSTSPIFLRYLS